MKPASLFTSDSPHESSSTCIPYANMQDADVSLYPGLFSQDDANRYFKTLLKDSDWMQEQIKIYGKQIDIPRLTAWCGAPNKTYTYSGIRVVSTAWTDMLLEIKSCIEEVSNTTFNSVLLNLYRHGADSVAWHADDERELGESPVIGSVSLGAERTFQMKHKTDPAHQKPLNILLENGSYLLMKGTTQHHWVHQIPKTKKDTNERINLTFRNIIDWDEMGYST